MAEECRVLVAVRLRRQRCLLRHLHHLCLLARHLLDVLRWYCLFYLGFALWGILVHINKWLYKWSLAFPKLSNSLPVRIFAFVLGSTLFSYVGMFLSMLDWNDAVAFHSDVHYWGTILLLIGLALSLLVRPPRVDKK